MLPIRNNHQIKLMRTPILNRNNPLLTVDIHNLTPELNDRRLPHPLRIQSPLLQLLMHIDTMIEIPGTPIRLLDMIKPERRPHILQRIALRPPHLDIRNPTGLLRIESPRLK